MSQHELPSVSGLPWQGVAYFCTTRQGGVSQSSWASLNLGLHTADNAANVAANRRTVRACLPGEPLWLDQVHGTHVVNADCFPELSQSHDMPAPTGDAAITVVPNTVLAIMTADCLPVVLANEEGSALGMAHAGWRGLCGGVLERTVNALRASAPSSSGWRAWIGPGIGQRHFEVGPDVYHAFVDADPGARIFFVQKTPSEKWLADLASLARYRLHGAGVCNVELSGDCTYSRPDLFFSFRREPITGRQATFAWLTEGDQVRGQG